MDGTSFGWVPIASLSIAALWLVGLLMVLVSFAIRARSRDCGCTTSAQSFGSSH